MTLWRIQAVVDESPGRLAALTTALALCQGNILDLTVQPDSHGAVDEFFVMAPPSVGQDLLVNALTTAGGRDVRMRQAGMDELVDAATRALGLAARLSSDLEELPGVLLELLGADAAEVLPATAGSTGEAATPDSGDDLHFLLVPLPDGSTVRLARRALVFTATEAARADALVRLAERLSGSGRPPEPASHCHVVLSDESELLVRPGLPGDASAAAQLHRRCSPETRRLRYFSPRHRLSAGMLERLLDRRYGHTLVAVSPQGQLVAMGHLLPTAEPGVAEVALLVEDAWQHRGLGTVLLRRLLALGRCQGFAELSAYVPPGHTRMLRLLRRVGAAEEFDMADGLVRVRIPLSPVVIASGQPAPARSGG
ncbi:hypothetical protein TH66_10030 [Carbonactinospora thermoautotrophica]|uniref:N-acetyltransferase domain-containing protein n=2 Tax=Carbonactinospora thermoautotrophica TaxID=1469144 RepID=A0A132NJM6_9ACTN|nr:GNAT family N-acetyltransferase [Carbonactinospora thermoautotrophica]KWX04206.1 hypothetical protein TH66_10030 [Carbonactinospora thermoautotrophica]KWX10137.1 hypothetical protein TR74_05445 [Carbonactinospora thermoautotrophica]